MSSMPSFNTPASPLPDVIVLEILLQSDPSTLKNARLASHAFNDLISTYGVSIKTRLLTRFTTADIVEHFSLPWHEDSPILSIFDIERRINLARWMATVALKDRIPFPSTFPEEFGDPSTMHQYIRLADMWTHIIKGLGIMWQLSDIAATTVMPSRSLLECKAIDKASLSPLQLEEQVLERQALWVKGLDMSSRMSLWFTIGYCVRDLYRNRGFEMKDDGETKVLGLYEQRNREKWAAWFIRRQGPDFVATAWRSTTGNIEMTQKLANELTARNETQRQVERDAGCTFLLVLHRSLPGSRLFWGSPPGSPKLIATSGGEIDEMEEWMQANMEQSPGQNNVALNLGQRSRVVWSQEDYRIESIDAVPQLDSWPS